MCMGVRWLNLLPSRRSGLHLPAVELVCFRRRSFQFLLATESLLICARVRVCACMHVCGNASWLSECVLSAWTASDGGERPAGLSASRTWPPHTAHFCHI